MEKHREISVVSGNIIEHGKRAIDNAWKTPSYLQCILQTIPLIDKIVDKSLGYDLSYYSESEISAVEAIKGCFFIARSDIFKEIGYFDEDTFDAMIAFSIKSASKVLRSDSSMILLMK